MEIAQTNIQLYNQLMATGHWSDADLTTLRKGYDLSRQLFASAYRPSHKPFISHLVGTASVLASWSERPVVVAAGLLHSVYLYGNFGDREKGATNRRRQYVVEQVGEDIESLVFAYTEEKVDDPLASENRDFLALTLADLYDELLDLGSAYAPVKIPRELRKKEGDAGAAVIQVASRVIGPEAGLAFEDAIRAVGQATIPNCLTTLDNASMRVKEGIPELKKLRKRSILDRIFSRGSKK